MAICICLLLFNLVYFARDFFKRKRDPEMVRKYMNKLCEMLETSGVEKISQKEEKFWTRKLSKSSGLILFQQAVEELEAKGKQEDIEKWVRNNRDLFYKLSSAYMKKRGMEKALMAYIIEQHHLCGSTGAMPCPWRRCGWRRSPLAPTMLPETTRSSTRPTSVGASIVCWRTA